jgi:hypothetical protein
VKHDEEKRMTITRYRKGACAGDGGYRFATNRKLAGFIFVLSICLSNVLGAQRPGARSSENPTVKSDERTEGLGPFDQETNRQRRTPLGVQVPVDRSLEEQRRGDAVEPASDALRRLGVLNGKPDQSGSDRVAGGTVTVHTASGPIAFDVTLIQNGDPGSQRILLRQPDGKSWDGRPDHLAPGAGPALEFLETQYRRGLQQLLNFQGHDAAVSDNGIKDSLRVVTVQEDNGQSTKYSLDPATSRMTRFEFVRGESPVSDPNTGSVVHSYSFADFRSADGVATPFHIEHFINGVKQEELQLTTVRYNSTAIGASAVRTAGR